MSEIHVTGLADLQKFLDTLPVKVEKNILRGALRAGANVIKADAKANCPVGQPSAENVRLYGGYAGALRDSIRSGTSGKGGKAMAYIRAGGKNAKTKADVFYAHMVEWGTSAHLIQAGKGGALSFLNLFVKSVNHPGMRAKAFMRPALDHQAGAAVVAAAEYMKARLATKHGLDTADIEIGIEE